MNFVLPILIGAVVIGISVRKMTPWLWLLMAMWIALVVAYHYWKGS